MNRNESTARTRHTRKARLRSLAARPALTALVAAGMIAGSTGMAVAVNLVIGAGTGIRLRTTRTGA